MDSAVSAINKEMRVTNSANDGRVLCLVEINSISPRFKKGLFYL